MSSSSVTNTGFSQSIDLYNSLEWQQCVPKNKHVTENTEPYNSQAFHTVYQVAPSSLFAAPNDKPRGITVLHINDLHGEIMAQKEDPIGGLPRITTAILNIAEENAAKNFRTVFAIAGDIFLGGIDTDGTVVTAALKKMQSVLKEHGVQVVAVIGNHEFDHGIKTLAEYITGVGFPVLGANILIGYYDFENNMSVMLDTRSKVLDIGGAKLGIIGLSTDDAVKPAILDKNGSASIGNPLKFFASEEMRVLSLEPDATIVLSHIGEERKEPLASMTGRETVDAIIGAHSHGRRPDYEAPSYDFCQEFRNLSYCRLPSGSSFLGRIDITFGKDGNGNKVETSTMPIIRSIEPDEEMELFIQGALDMQPYMYPANYEIVGRMPEKWWIQDKTVTPTPLQFEYYVMQTMAKAVPEAEIVIFNTGTVRSHKWKDLRGDITWGTFKKILPFDNKICLVEIDGKTLKTMLEKSKNDKNLALRLYAYNLPAELEDKKIYKIATADYLLTIDHTFFKECTPFKVQTKDGQPLTMQGIVMDSLVKD